MNLLLCAILAAVLLAAPATAQTPPADGLPSVVCFGDSITAGVGATPDTRWEADLQRLGAGRLHTINEGVGGRTLADAISPRQDGRYRNGLQEPLPPDGTPTLAQDVVGRHPEADTVVVFLGVNDLKDNRTDGADKAALALARAGTLLDQIQSVRPQMRIVLCCPANINPQTVSDINRAKKYDAQTSAWIKTLSRTLAILARQKRAVYCNLEPVVSPANYIDGLHPNPDGHAQIAQAVWDVLRPLLPPFYPRLGEYSDLPAAAERSHPLWPTARPGPATQAKVRDVLAFAPGDEQPQAVRVERRWQKDGVTGEEVSWSVGYGPRTLAWLLRPTGAIGRLPGIVALHDHGGFYFYGKEKIADGPDPTPEVLIAYRAKLYGGRAFANDLARRGFAVLVPDVFLWGSRRFSPETMAGPPPTVPAPSAPAPADATSADPVAAYNKSASKNEGDVEKYCLALGTSLPGVVSYEDRVAVNYLASQPDVDAGRLGCIGLSGGGLRAALLQATSPRIRAAVIVSMMSTYAGLLDHNIPSHTWMLYPPGWSRIGEYPDLAACRAPSPLLVQFNRQDPLFTTAGMQGADRRIAQDYAAVGARSAYTGQFYDGPHKFDAAMQDAAFAWLAGRLGR